MKKTIYILIAGALTQGCDSVLKTPSDQETKKEKKENQKRANLRENLKKSKRYYLPNKIKKKEYFLLNNADKSIEMDIIADDYDDDDEEKESCNELIYVVLQEKEDFLDFKNVLNKSSIRNTRTKTDGESYFDTLIKEKDDEKCTITISSKGNQSAPEVIYIHIISKTNKNYKEKKEIKIIKRKEGINTKKIGCYFEDEFAVSIENKENAEFQKAMSEIDYEKIKVINENSSKDAEWEFVNFKQASLFNKRKNKCALFFKATHDFYMKGKIEKDYILGDSMINKTKPFALKVKNKGYAISSKVGIQKTSDYDFIFYKIKNIIKNPELETISIFKKNTELTENMKVLVTIMEKNIINIGLMIGVNETKNIDNLTKVINQMMDNTSDQANNDIIHINEEELNNKCDALKENQEEQANLNSNLYVKYRLNGDIIFREIEKDNYQTTTEDPNTECIIYSAGNDSNCAIKAKGDTILLEIKDTVKNQTEEESCKKLRVEIDNLQNQLNKNKIIIHDIDTISNN